MSPRDGGSGIEMGTLVGGVSFSLRLPSSSVGPIGSHIASLLFRSPETKSGWPITTSAATKFWVGTALKMVIRLKPRSATNIRPPETVTDTGSSIRWLSGSYTPSRRSGAWRVFRSGWPSTRSGAWALEVGIVFQIRMRLFCVSATKRRSPSSHTPWGPRMPVGEVSGALAEKSGWPSTTSGSVPFTSGIELQSRTRLLLVSATARRMPSLCTADGLLRPGTSGRSEESVVSKSGCPSTVSGRPTQAGHAASWGRRASGSGTKPDTFS